MTPRTTIKLVLSLGGLLLFGAGIRFENDLLRWIGLGAVAVAWLMRFSKPANLPSNKEPPHDVA